MAHEKIQRLSEHFVLSLGSAVSPSVVAFVITISSRLSFFVVGLLFWVF